MIFFEVKNLKVGFNGNPVLESLSFALEKGKALAVIGPNGAGKTVLLKTLLGAYPYTGQVVWHHRPVFGYVPQRFEINRTTPLTVGELFALHQRSQGFWFFSPKLEAEAKRHLNHVGAQGLWKQKVAVLSRGQLQRVLIAYALFGNPNIIFFDEPTASIDVEGEQVLHKLLRHLNRELGITLVIVTHDLNIAYKFADQALCLNRKMFCYGLPKDILTPKQLGTLYGTGEEFVHMHHHE